MKDWHIASGYRFAGFVSRLRSEPDRRDLALVVSDRPAAAAGVFTQNRVCAAPVQISRERLPSNEIRGFVVCSGNANACTGEQGLADARRMAELTANGIGSEPRQILVASTGVIGRPLPMPILEAGIPFATAALQSGAEAFNDVAHAILTTDTKIKVSTRRFGEYAITGFAKGAAMIGPNLATMLGFVLTDAPVAAGDLHAILKRAASDTFNCVSVEGHTSTNDTVFLLANGEGPKLTGEELAAFETEIRAVCGELARAIAEDAEGANHLVIIDVEGCRNNAEARTIAKTVAESALVKTAIFGADPNWGRVISAAGYSGVAFDEKDLSLTMGPFLLYEGGTPLPFDAELASGYLKQNRNVEFRLIFNHGAGGCRFYTCDLTTEYVTLNADYTT